MERINSESELIGKLIDDVRKSNKHNIVYLAGHFPVNYSAERAYEDFDSWGFFPEYTLDLACRVARETPEKDASFALIADDLLFEHPAVMEGLDRHRISRLRNSFYKSVSGDSASTHSKFSQILRKYGFNENDVIRYNHGKSGREDCLYISEKVLRAQRTEELTECAKAYIQFLESPQLFDRASSHLVAFIPDRCSGKICTSVLTDTDYSDGLSASHVFMQADPYLLKAVSKKDLWDTFGVLYRKD